MMSSSSLISTLSSASFSTKLEKHLGDVRHGVGYLSSDTASELYGRQDAVGLGLAPKNLAAYSGYFSALSYDKRSRFVNGVYESTIAHNPLDFYA